LIGTAAVFAANVLLRPLGYRINQQPLKGTELEICYRVEIICRSKHEVQIRALLLQAINTSKLKLRSLHNEEIEDLPGKVSVEADLVTQERDDSYLEGLVSRLSLEQGISSVKWRIIEEEYG
jgi:putative Mg2+ transporter-C (MgtC) family protein